MHGKPQESDTAPLVDLPGKEVVLWDDFRYQPGSASHRGSSLDLGTFNLWLEGQAARVRQHGKAGFVYDEDAPVFFTGPDLSTKYFVPPSRGSRLLAGRKRASAPTSEWRKSRNGFSRCRDSL